MLTDERQIDCIAVNRCPIGPELRLGLSASPGVSAPLPFSGRRGARRYNHRVRRRLLNLLTVLSLVLSLAVVGSWLASYANLTFLASRGVLHVVRVPPDQDVSNPVSVDVERWVNDDRVVLTIGQFVEDGVRENFQPLRTPPTWETKGLRYWDVKGFRAGPTARGRSWPVRVQVLSLSYGWLALAAMAYPGIRLGRWAGRLATARRRRRRNQCPSCGYDLRATPGRCPECGTTG